MVAKYEKDGEIAVLISLGYGAGWSTWCSNKELAEQIIFDPVLVQLLLNEAPRNEIDDYVQARYEGLCYTGGAKDLVVRWVPKGVLFRIEEYDGAESLTYLGNIEWYKA